MDNELPARPAPEKRTIDQAVEVFVRGFSFTRSFTYPYLAERVGPLWVMRDAPRTRGDYRNEEWVAHDVDPAEIDRIARAHTRGRFAICAICGRADDQTVIRRAFKALGYRLGSSEALMVHALREIPQFAAPARVERVASPELASRLAKTAGTRPTRAEHFAPDSPLRQYVALVDDEVVGWVASVMTGQATWCCNMFVQPEFRRRGIARSMLCRLLADDRSVGANQAVLLASHTGAKLYPLAGYEQIGELLLFTPKRR
ncbi:MAG TPA: GNAT family N-acetyltransferase [Caldilineaceae bacterium]|nr:GNAT family N-acetyltransferase [Caldilineaceae bacterium]